MGGLAKRYVLVGAWKSDRRAGRQAGREGGTKGGRKEGKQTNRHAGSQPARCLRSIGRSMGR
eukprot:6196641-Pleurochrysis_carterae.AAC.5